MYNMVRWKDHNLVFAVDDDNGIVPLITEQIEGRARLPVCSRWSKSLSVCL